ncbi:MAG: CAP domain-containing protein [Cryomorphaceae bacterium]
MIYFLTVLLTCFNTSYASTLETNVPGCLLEDEVELANLINDYRTEHDLPPIPLSKSLTVVAKTHAADLFKEKPFDEKSCNPHSWSDSGDWKACCYGYNTHNGPCMWEKPREITDYEGDGFEIVMFSENSQFPDKTVSAKAAFESWIKSVNHNSVILNKGIWEKVEWNAMGVGIYKGFAAVWFGRENDPAGLAEACEN